MSEIFSISESRERRLGSDDVHNKCEDHINRSGSESKSTMFVKGELSIVDAGEE